MQNALRFPGRLYSPIREADSSSKIMMDPSLDATISRVWSMNPNDSTALGVSSTITDVSAGSVDQTRICPPLSPDAMRRPSGENVTHTTQFKCPAYLLTCKPFAASQIMTVLSLEPEAMSMPLGEYATEKTSSQWPVMTCRRAPVATSHSLTVVSYEPDTSRLPSGENAMWPHGRLCPSSTRTHWLHVLSRPSLISTPDCDFGPYTRDSRDSDGRNGII